MKKFLKIGQLALVVMLLIGLNSCELEKKIRKHFANNPLPMTELEIGRFKEVFSGIVAQEPGELKLILKNGNEMYWTYTPMRGQVKHAKENRVYTCKADKRA